MTQFYMGSYQDMNMYRQFVYAICNTLYLSIRKSNVNLHASTVITQRTEHSVQSHS